MSTSVESVLCLISTVLNAREGQKGADWHQALKELNDLLEEYQIEKVEPATLYYSFQYDDHINEVECACRLLGEGIWEGLDITDDTINASFDRERLERLLGLHEDEDEDEAEVGPPEPTLTLDQMMAIRPHPGWSDGRGGYCYYRFDAALGDETNHFPRAELTWDDNSEEPLYDDRSEEWLNAHIRFRRPELMLENNHFVGTDLVTYDAVVLSLTQEEAIAVAEADPRELLVKYAAEFASLQTPSTLSSHPADLAQVG